ncbi:MAG: GIY-YIG nuclease family protein [Phormidesmis sp. CAN_BIN44]|nr:GIY-YIG nuclease family protein [Phormidesmis sp. CAN_BIN44]
MSDSFDSITQEGLKILETLADMPFEECCSLGRNFTNALTRRPSIYAVKHRTQGILYVGKAKYTKERFRDGHKAFFWAWLERFDPEDVRIAFALLSYRQWSQLLSELETIILQASKPPYNVIIPMRD